MKCPHCADTTLAMTQRNDIEIDYCPKCRGVWLDRGELDKIIERSSQTLSSSGSAVQRSSVPPREHYDNGYYKKKKKREGFLSDLFDFD
ncbi:zf-TFIIB domain-containing protein [Comamonas nitrativorans]|uniref:Zf-TFIIB domain-containing protein n=1 Tax=Comamonas nitrativorans TaxID=108437 RepID=A0ABV9GV35_9BURK